MSSEHRWMAADVTMVFGDDSGNSESVVLRPAHERRPTYVCVGEPGHGSGLWRIWGANAGSGKSDVFVAARNVAGVQKISLHESGDWRCQWVGATNAERFTGSPDNCSATLRTMTMASLMVMGTVV